MSARSWLAAVALVAVACGSGSGTGSQCGDHVGTYLAHYVGPSSGCPTIADFETVPTESVLPVGCTDHSQEAGDLCSMTVLGVCTGPVSGSITWSTDGSSGRGSVLLPSCGTAYAVTLTKK